MRFVTAIAFAFEPLRRFPLAGAARERLARFPNGLNHLAFPVMAAPGRPALAGRSGGLPAAHVDTRDKPEDDGEGGSAR
jgi:hypothetical protein